MVFKFRHLDINCDLKYFSCAKKKAHEDIQPVGYLFTERIIKKKLAKEMLQRIVTEKLPWLE